MNALLHELLARFERLEKKTEEHLMEASGVRTELRWLRKMVWLLLSIEITARVTAVLERITH